jgi:trehalose/maltose transport system permease protein
VGRKTKRVLGRVGFYLLLALIIFYTVFPFYWAVISSLETGSALFQVDFWPTDPAWDNYLAVFREQPFGRNILNSIIVAVSTVLLSLGLAVLAAASASAAAPRSFSSCLASRCSHRLPCSRACSS